MFGKHSEGSDDFCRSLLFCVFLLLLISICMDEDKPKTKRKKKETCGERKPRSAHGDASRKQNWREYMVTVEEIQDFLMERMQLRHNVVTGRTEYRLPSTYGREGTEWAPVTDRVVNSLWTELSATKTVRAPLESS